MTRFSFRYFEHYPPGPARISNVIRQLQQTEVGRLFLMNLPRNVTFQFIQGDATARASTYTPLALISLPPNTFRGAFETEQTVIHELAHTLQIVPQLDPLLVPYMEGIFSTLNRHRGDRRFGWVTEPLDRVRNEETMAQDVVGLIFRFGWGRNYHDRYYVPGDEASPPSGALRPTLSASDRATFLAAMGRMRARALSPEQVRANWEGFREFYTRALKVGWVGEDAGFSARLASERRRRGASIPHR